MAAEGPGKRPAPLSRDREPLRVMGKSAYPDDWAPIDNHPRFAKAPPRMGYAAKLAAAGIAAEGSMPSDGRCGDLTSKGSPCKARPMADTGFCAGHSRKRGLIL